MSYRRRASPLHAARAAVAILWCVALAAAALLTSNPVILAALALTVLAAGVLAGCARQLRRGLALAVPLCLTIALINALVSRQGLTVIWRFGQVPLLGQTNVTLEATVFGAVLGLRAAVLVLLGTLYSVAVDPDAVLRLCRRASFHSALSATIATRMVPVLMRDAQRVAEAQRCRPGAPPGRLELLRASATGALDRALDVAATLEVRGYGHAHAGAVRRLGHPRRPWSRHDIGFAAGAAAVLGVSVVSQLAGFAGFVAYPLLRVQAGPRTLVVAALIAATALAPFADRRGILT